MTGSREEIAAGTVLIRQGQPMNALTSSGRSLTVSISKLTKIQWVAPLLALEGGKCQGVRSLD